jgi:hypothetical protein
MNDDLDSLRREFDAGDGSFLLRVRTELVWDRAAFSRLALAMEACCERFAERSSLDRWLAEGFWYVSTFVKDWTTHPSFPRVEPEEYYIECYERLDQLAFWFFTGESPYEEGRGFEPL